jgi:hypothetical protein
MKDRTSTRLEKLGDTYQMVNQRTDK